MRAVKERQKREKDALSGRLMDTGKRKSEDDNNAVDSYFPEN